MLEEVEGAIGQKTVRYWNGRHYEEQVYRWAEALPLRRGENALLVNWCELTVFHGTTGERMYHNGWATNHKVGETTVKEIAAAGRARWKVENEGVNVLKNHGYHFSHNYGHGEKHLSNVLLSFLLLSFLMHSVLHMTCKRYQAIRQALGARRKFSETLHTLTTFFHFSGWQQLLTFIYQRLELEPG